MTPGQIVAHLDRLQGIELVGEEQLAGRTAVKYRYARTAQTQTSAGEVKTESFIYVDKDTGLPLRAELFSEASGNVQGVKGANVVAEMQNISTNVDPSLFEIPPGFNKVPEAQVRAQVDAVANTLLAVLRALLQSRRQRHRLHRRRQLHHRRRVQDRSRTVKVTNDRYVRCSHSRNSARRRRCDLLSRSAAGEVSAWSGGSRA